MPLDSQSVAFPDEPQFKRFVEHCVLSPHRVALYDERNDVNASFEQILRDVQATRQSFVNGLPQTMFCSNGFTIAEGKTLFVPILAPTIYEFLVAALAVLATGGALIPLATSISPEEAMYPLQKCKSTFLLASPAQDRHATDIQRHALSRGRDMEVFSIQTGTSSAIRPIPKIDENGAIGPSRPGVVLFTSGTTGPPKGVVLPRSQLDVPALPGKAPGVVTLFCRATNHLSGCGIILPTIFAGGTLDVVPRDAAVLWERLRKWDYTVLTSTPPLWRQMMDHFHDHIAHLPTEERGQYIRGARNLRSAKIYGAAPSISLLKFWLDLGKPLVTTYASTEAGGYVFMTTRDTNHELIGCIGRPVPGVDVRLSEGNEGELFIKTRTMLTHFLDDRVATRAAFTDDGFYKTGDLIRRVGDDYFMMGRVSSDFIRYYGHRIPILEVESYLSEIPLVKEAYVLSVPDAYTCARVAVLVRFNTGSHNCQNGLDLAYIRSHLSQKLAPHKLPTVMRTLNKGEYIYSTFTEKIIRGKTREKFFPVSETFALPADVEVWDD